MKNCECDRCSLKLTMNEYQASAIKTAVYIESAEALTDDEGLRSLLRLFYVATKLAGEAGEVAEKVGKILRDHDGILTEELAADLVLELGDVLWYSAATADEIGYTLEAIARANLDKLARRALAGTIKGSGDSRDAGELKRRTVK